MMSFAATIGDWGRAELGRAEAIFQDAAQTVADEVRTTINEGGRLPIDLGNLRRSLMASTADMPAVKPEQISFSGSQVEMVIAGAQLGSTIYLGFQAAYAARMEYGFVGTDSLGRVYNQAGFGFVAASAQRWPQTVAASEAKIRSRFEGSPAQTG
jgi:hypothetical protein